MKEEKLGRRGPGVFSVSHQLIHIAFVIRVGITAAPLLHVDHALVKMGQRHCVLFVDMALHVSLQQGALVVWEGHGEEGFRVTNKLVNVSLTGDLGGVGKTKTPIVKRCPKKRATCEDSNRNNEYTKKHKLRLCKAFISFKVIVQEGIV